MSTNVNIRQAIEDDAEKLQRFMTSLWAERLPVLFREGRPPTIEEELDFVTRVLDLPRSRMLVAETDQEIVGILDFQGHQRPQQSHAGKFGISVAKSWRSRKIGSRLIESLLAWARAENIRRVELDVFSNNSRAIALYERLGFRKEGRQVGAIEVDGAYIDLLMMAKLL